MLHWKTTLGGILAAIGGALSGQDGWLGYIGKGLLMIGPLILGTAAADSTAVVTKK